MKYILVALSMASVDFFWARYMIAVTARQAWRAAAWSSSIILLGAFVTLSYVHEHGMIVAAAIGAFIGTFATVRFTKQ